MTSIIQQPDPLPSPKDNGSLALLRNLMSKTHTDCQFKRFLNIARGLRRELSFPPGKSPGQVKVDLWETWAKKVAERIPKLKLYQNYWPLLVYGNYLAKKHKARQRRQHLALESPPARAKSTTVKQGQNHTKKTRYFVGKPPLWATGGIRDATLPELRTSRTLSVLSSSYREEAPSPESPCFDNPLALVISCPRCPWTPDVPSSQTTKLQTFLASASHVANPSKPTTHLLALRSSGLITDAHFELLLEWPEDAQRAFFEAIDPTQITPWDKLQILKKLKAVAASQKNIWSVAPEARSTWQPGRVDEELMTDPSRPLSLLEDAMQLGTHELFEDVLAHIQALAQPYLSTYFPSPSQLEETVLHIAHDREVYDDYEHYWPIRFYIKRLVRKLGNKPLGPDGKVLDGGLDVRDVPESSRWKTRPSLRKKRISTTEPHRDLHCSCPYHPFVDTQAALQDIQRYLHHQGLPEFIPALVLVGITTSDQFLHFCMLDEVEKVDLFSDTRILHLTPFQRVCLKTEFSVERVEGEGFTTSTN